MQHKLFAHKYLTGTFYRADTGAPLLEVNLRQCPGVGDTIEFQPGVPWKVEAVHWVAEHDHRFKAVQWHVRIRCVPDLR